MHETFASVNHFRIFMSVVLWSVLRRVGNQKDLQSRSSKEVNERKKHALRQPRLSSKGSFFGYFLLHKPIIFPTPPIPHRPPMAGNTKNITSK
jgi:hypothetical protein